MKAIPSADTGKLVVFYEALQFSFPFGISVTTYNERMSSFSFPPEAFETSTGRDQWF